MRSGAAGRGTMNEGHRRSYCNESSVINAISRNEKRIDEAGQDLKTFTHMRNGAQVDESVRREAQEDSVRARRDRSAVGHVAIDRRKLRLRRRRRLCERQVRAAGSTEDVSGAAPTVKIPA